MFHQRRNKLNVIFLVLSVRKNESKFQNNAFLLAHGTSCYLNHDLFLRTDTSKTGNFQHLHFLYHSFHNKAVITSMTSAMEYQFWVITKSGNYLQN